MFTKPPSKFKLLSRTALLTVLLVASSAPVLAATGDDTVIAKSNNATVTFGELKKFLTLANAKATPEAIAEVFKSSKDVQALAGEILQRKILIKEAEAKKLADKPDVMEKIDIMRGEILQNSMIETAVPASSVATPNEAEVRDDFEKNKKSLKVPKRVDISWIYVRSMPEDDAGYRKSQKTKIDEIASDLKAGSKTKEAFAKVARLGSEDSATRDKGGAIGVPVEFDKLPSADMRAALDAMKPGDISAPINVPGQGWYVVRLNEMKPGGTPVYEEVKEEWVAKVKADKLNAARKAYIEGLMRTNKGDVDEAAIAKLTQQ
ncbi:MAG: peptidylprolyl isomerase [Alphaproteobacteria bacterium]|nr:peptidylprolyl isomerase [Alphaproteobacteria bacterium]